MEGSSLGVAVWAEVRHKMAIQSRCTWHSKLVVKAAISNDICLGKAPTSRSSLGVDVLVGTIVTYRIVLRLCKRLQSI